MAINPSTVYPAQVDTTDPTGYPLGKARNINAVGDGSGFPLEKTWVNDLLGFEQALLAAAAITPNGAPDRVGASQYLNAIQALIAAGANQSQIRMQLQNWPERARAVLPGFGADNGPAVIAWGNGLSGTATKSRFCAFGGQGTCAYSDDGSFWTQGAFNPGLFNRPQCMDFGFVAGQNVFLVGDSASGSVWSSPDGGKTPWSEHPSGVVSTVTAMAYSPTVGWVIGGTGEVAVSSNGTAWGAGLVSLWAGKKIAKIVWNGSIFMAMSSDIVDAVLTSTDGVSWLVRNVGAFDAWRGLVWSSTLSMWLLVGTGYVFKSPDGVTWTNCSNSGHPSPTGYASPVGLATLNGAFVAPIVSGVLGGMMFSTDLGTTWTRVSVGDMNGTTQGFTGCIAADSRFVIARSGPNYLDFCFTPRVG